MAVPHYAYLKLKIPGSTCVIIVIGSFTKSDQCDRDFHKVFDTFGAEQELKEIDMATDRSVFSLASRSESKEYGRDFSIDSDTVTHQVHPTDPKKQSVCTPTFRKSKQLPSSPSSVKSGKSSPGAQPICQEYRAISQNTHYASSRTRNQ